ncbi:MAG: hypothetical protein JWR38_1686 [Mucilaginibacter sp.]|nr:hypothetical protein [Mucilaginibacter sp.]
MMDPGLIAAILVLGIVAAMSLYVIIKMLINRYRRKDDLDGIL